MGPATSQSKAAPSSSSKSLAVYDIPLSLSVQLLPPRQGRLTIRFRPSPLRCLTIFTLMSPCPSRCFQEYIPLVVLFSVKFLRKPRFICSGLLDSPLPEPESVRHHASREPPDKAQTLLCRFERPDREGVDVYTASVSGLAV